jgi:hypothetical protein
MSIRMVMVADLLLRLLLVTAERSTEPLNAARPMRA